MSLRSLDILYITAFASVGALVGARLFGALGQIFIHSTESGFWTVDNWKLILRGSGVFYGGLFGSICMSALGTKLCHIEMKSMFNAFAYAVPAFQCIARLGCYFVGCCYGIELSNSMRLPIQLFEALYCAVLLSFFLILRPECHKPDIPLLPVIIVSYSIGRFVLEFFRGDTNRGVWILSTSQWIALFLIIILLPKLKGCFKVSSLKRIK